jgi:molybdate transport system regulatory protein
VPSKKAALQPSGSISLSHNGENVLNETRFTLLEQIAATGSITQAGRAAGISYRTAWLAIDHLNELSDKPLVVRTTGGKTGGGTRLTPEGESLLRIYKAVRADHVRYLEHLRLGLEDFDRFLRLTRKLALKTSARNQLFGKVERVSGDKLGAKVILGLHGHAHSHSHSMSAIRLVAQITQESVENLGLRVGTEAYALIKANWVTLKRVTPKSAMTRQVTPKRRSDKSENLLGISSLGTNCFVGEVSSHREMGSQAEITVRLSSGQEMVSVMPIQAYHSLRPEVGVAVEALCAAEHVIVGVAA